MELEYLPITHDEMPIQKSFTIGAQNHAIEFLYNDRFDFYTVVFRDEDDEPVYSTRLNYLTDAIHAVVDDIDVSLQLVAMNIADMGRQYSEIERIGIDNFDSMRLCVL